MHVNKHCTLTTHGLVSSSLGICSWLEQTGGKLCSEKQGLSVCTWVVGVLSMGVMLWQLIDYYCFIWLLLF